MSDNRRHQRPDSRQMWDESDRRGPRDREREHDGDRRGGRAGGGRGPRDGSRDRKGPPRDRSRSPNRRFRDRDDDRDRGARGDRRSGDGARRNDDRDWKERRGDGDRAQRRGKGLHVPTTEKFKSLTQYAYIARDNRSRSPAPASLPTRPRADQKPQSTSRNSRRSPSPGADLPDTNERMDEDNDRSPKAGEEEPEEELDEDEAAMQAMMGFGGFGTTKGKKVAGNNAGAIKKEKKTEYRQYMNRVGGFNRPLSPSR
ncbi:hypothetical protein CC79DRAFT_756157 [Sarocladium strictum]